MSLKNLPGPEGWVPLRIIPYTSVGLIRFGMTKDEVRELLGPDEGPLALQGVFYSRPILRVAFGTDGGCNWVATDESTKPVIVDVPLVGGFDDVVAALTTNGYFARFGTTETADCGYAYFDELGLHLGRLDPEDKKIDAIAAWRYGFWEEYPAH